MRSRELTTLKRLLAQLDGVLSAPGDSKARAKELLSAARALTDDLLNQAKLPAAALLGAKGGMQTAKRGPEYFRQLAAKRKTLGGGRPRKQAD
jgi:hypothetical protein